jgi:hypothetical protein
LLIESNAGVFAPKRHKSLRLFTTYFFAKIPQISSLAVAKPSKMRIILHRFLTGTPFGYKREDGVYVIPIGCLKN